MDLFVTNGGKKEKSDTEIEGDYLLKCRWWGFLTNKPTTLERTQSAVCQIRDPNTVNHKESEKSRKWFL